MAGIDRAALEEEGIIKETSRIHAHSISYISFTCALGFAAVWSAC